MTVHLPEDLERFVKDAVRAGRYAREEDVVRDALTRLQKDRPEEKAPAKSKRTKRAKPAASRKTSAAGPAKTPMTEEEFERHLLAIGMLSRLPDPAEDLDDDDPDDLPVTIEGEPLSETIIRERR